MKDQKVTPYIFGIGSFVAASLASSVSADEEEKLFLAQALDADLNTITGAHGGGEGECGEAEKDEAKSEGECGEGECGEGECGEGECGEEEDADDSEEAEEETEEETEEE